MSSNPEIDIHNKLVITNLDNNDIAEINFKKTKDELNFEIRGSVKNNEGETILYLTG